MNTANKEKELTTEDQKMFMDLTKEIKDIDTSGMSDYESAEVLLRPFYLKYQELGFLNKRTDPVIKKILGELYPEDFI